MANLRCSLIFGSIRPQQDWPHIMPVRKCPFSYIPLIMSAKTSKLTVKIVIDFGSKYSIISGVFHGCDEIFLFELERRFLSKRKDRNWQLDRRVTELFATMIVNFLKYGYYPFSTNVIHSPSKVNQHRNQPASPSIGLPPQPPNSTICPLRIHRKWKLDSDGRRMFFGINMVSLTNKRINSICFLTLFRLFIKLIPPLSKIYSAWGKWIENRRINLLNN